jgi:hypothetical protein
MAEIFSYYRTKYIYIHVKKFLEKKKSRENEWKERKYDDETR